MAEDFDVWLYLAQVAPVVVVMAVIGRVMYSYFTRQVDHLREERERLVERKDELIAVKDQQIEKIYVAFQELAIQSNGLITLVDENLRRAEERDKEQSKTTHEEIQEMKQSLHEIRVMLKQRE